MTINIKKIAADIVAVGLAISVVLAIVLNVAHGVNLPAADVAWIVAASSIVTAVVNAVKPFAAATVAKALGLKKPR